ncbi:MAG: VWA domain-containing protein [Pseudomonadota bacterium]
MLPAGAQSLVAFPTLLRANGFAVAPDQTMSFVEAVGLLGPRRMDHIRRAAVATLAIAQDRRADFDALFDAHFLDAALPDAMPGDDEEVEAHEGTGETAEIPEESSDDEPGDEATAAERLGHRMLADQPEEALAALRRHGPTRLPMRRSRRFRAARDGRVLDMRRALREAARRDGEVLTLPHRRRRWRQRRIALLIDVSGSMADRTEGALRLAHALARVAERLEVFTLGTRLTRVTPALRLQNPARALERASALIADIDGGTRIGEALTAFLSVPRYVGFTRGAAVVVLSDGLERGEPSTLIAATRRLTRLAWRLDWLSPIAPEGTPQTEAMTALLPHLDHLGDGATTRAICDHLLTMVRQETRGAA